MNSFNKLSWDDINDVNLNINNKFDKFYEKVHHTVIEHVPLKKVNKKQLKLRLKPWVNSHIQKLIKHMEMLLRKLRKSHSAATEELYKNSETESLLKIERVRFSIMKIIFKNIRQI